MSHFSRAYRILPGGLAGLLAACSTSGASSVDASTPDVSIPDEGAFEVYRPDPSPPEAGLDAGLDSGDDASVGDDASADDGASFADLSVPPPSLCGPCTNLSCPATLPEAGAPCVPGCAEFPYDVIACEYGSDPRWGCNTSAECGTDGGWAVHYPPDAGNGCGPMPADCPTTFAAAETEAGAACTGSTVCWYGEGACGCVADPASSDGSTSSGSTWTCAAPAPDSGCPSDRPLTGTSCSSPMTTCSYGAYCEFGAGSSMLCCSGIWHGMGVGTCKPPPPLPPPPED